MICSAKAAVPVQGVAHAPLETSTVSTWLYASIRVYIAYVFRAVLIATLFASAAAHADRAKDLPHDVAAWVNAGGGHPMPPPRFMFTDYSAEDKPDENDHPALEAPDATTSKNAVVGISSDKTAMWLAVDLELTHVCGGCANKPDSWYHFTGLFDTKDSRPIAVHVATPVSSKDQAEALKKGVKVEAIPKQIDAGAEDAVKLFESTIADPAAFAKTVSDRKDVVLYGSELAERTVGGAKVRAQLGAWNLSFKIRDGIQAGVSSSKTVAWIAANVDAVPAKNRKAASAPYRVLAIYERTATGWAMVNAHFSFLPR